MLSKMEEKFIQHFLVLNPRNTRLKLRQFRVELCYFPNVAATTLTVCGGGYERVVERCPERRLIAGFFVGRRPSPNSWLHWKSPGCG